MHKYLKIFFMSYAFLSFFYIGTIKAHSIISWDFKEDSSNLSFFHYSSDLESIAPITVNKKIETAYEQYRRIFSDSANRKNYMDALESIIVRKNEVTEWDEKNNKYKTNYKTSCNINSPAAFCQEITLQLSNTISETCSWIIGDRDPITDSCKAHSTSVRINEDISVKVIDQNLPHKIIPPITVYVKGKVILGLGDSIGSGEGNPDRPTKHFDEIPREGSGYNFFLSHREDWNWDSEFAKKYEALWLDRTCHRSILSHQFNVALQFAANNPKQRIVFASFSCSGAEIINGLLDFQKNFPYTGNTAKPKAQLDSAIDFLCGDIGKNRIENECTKPDLILLSIGGNDVGFGPLAFLTFSPKLKLFSFIPVPDLFAMTAVKLGKYNTPEQARTKIYDYLSDYYDLLNNSLKSRKLDNIPIIQTNYPNFVTNCNQDWNNNSNQNPGMIELIFFENKYYGLGARGAKFFTNVEIPLPIISLLNKLEYSISKEEVENLSNLVITPLQAKVKENSKYGWTIVELDPEEVTKHGLCALDLDEESKPKPPEVTFGLSFREKEGIFPEWRKFAKNDNNEKPSTRQPYLYQRQRNFNTLDDSIMKSSTRECPESWQLPYADESCAEMLSGALHPDLSYHVKLADKIYEKAKIILQPSGNE